MATYTVKLDPSAVATGRTEFNINTGGIRVAGSGIDWGDAAISAFLADLKFGSVPVDFRVPNRQVTIPLAIFTTENGATIEETARRQLAEKVGLIHAEGGWLLRQRATGPPMYADVVDAALHVPDQWGETGAIEPDVNLVLQCLPDFYGDEVSSDVIAGTGFIDSVINQSGSPAVVAGDYPARMRIVISDTSGNDQHGMYVALRSKYYDSTGTARLVRNATQLAVLNGSTTPTLSGTLGGKVIQNTFVNSDGWLPIAGVMQSTGGALTHKGTYRVLVRVQGTSVPTQLQLMWQPGTLTGVPETNYPVYIPQVGETGTFFFVTDLGEVRIDPPILSGTSGWFGAIQALSDSGTGNTVKIDSVYFLPLDESAGRFSVASTLPEFSAATTNVTKKTPGTMADDGTSSGAGGGIDWRIPPTTWTTAIAELKNPGTAQDTSHYFKATNFGFSIPSSATVVGIQVGISREVEFGFVYDGPLRLVVNGSVVTPGRSVGAKWPSFHGKWNYYGGPTDLWGQSVTNLNPTGAGGGVNGTGFGFVVAAAYQEYFNAGSPIAAIFGVSMTVYYQLASGLVVAQDAVMYANQSCEVRTEGAWHYDASGVNPIPVRIQESDSFRLPPSLQEGRQCELFVDTSRGNMDPDPDNATADTGQDGLSAQVFWRPCYIERP